MPTLINHLAQLIAHDNAVLFVGAGLRQGADQPPAVQQIADALAARIQYQRPDRSLPAVAQVFEVTQDRNALIMALREELEKPGVDQPMPIYQLIADAVLPGTKIITTRFDRALEQALEQFQKPYVLIVRDTDVPFLDESKITLIKMQGDIGQPDSLVITEDDMRAFISRLPTIGDVVRAFFATKTLIFLGYDLDSEQFKQLFHQVTLNLRSFRRQAYAIVPQPMDKVDVRYWRGQNVEVHAQDPLVFLESLAQAVKAAIREPVPVPNPLVPETATPVLPSRPYKGLDSFTSADEAIFTSRLEESCHLTNRILAHRLTVLYGESGSGKTSLLQAGAGPRLARNRALLVTGAPVPGQPLLELMGRRLLETGLQTGLPGPGEGRTPAHIPGIGKDIIREWQRALDGPIVLAIDQFEQAFLVHNPEERQAAARTFGELLNDRSLDLRLVLIVREDFLGRLQTLEEELPGLLDVRFRLERLGREAARDAIEEPARLFDVTWEPALVETLLDDLYDSVDGGVAPPQLQIVCDYLYQMLVEQAGGPTGDGGVQITLAQFHGLGGTEAILGAYLDRALRSFPPDQQPTVRTLLGSLVSSGGVKQRLALDDLARAAGVEPEEGAAILEELTRQRLVRRYEVAVDGAGRGQVGVDYELAHDYLVARIARWLGDDFWAAQKAREIVRQALPEWQSRGRLLAQDDLRLVTTQRDRAAAQRDHMRFSIAEVEMLYAAAVSYDDRPAGWQATLAGAACRRILLQLLEHPEPFARRRAARQLAAFPGEDVSAALAQTALADPDPAVREAAARTIARPPGQDGEGVDQRAVARLVGATTDPSTADAALKALVIVRDLQPVTQEHLPADLHRRIQRRVWVLRWRRNRHEILTTTLRGMQGGFAGLGLGIGLFLGLYSVLASGFEGLDLPWQTIVSAMSVGVPLAGLIGMLAAGSGGFAGVVLRNLQDRERPWRTWLAITATSGVVLGLGFILLASVFGAFGQVRPLRSMLAGMVIGLGLAGAATAPLRLATVPRLGLATVAGVAAFVLAWSLRLIFNYTFWWLFLMGVPGSAGFFWGLNPGLRQTWLRRGEPGE